MTILDSHLKGPRKMKRHWFLVYCFVLGIGTAFMLGWISGRMNVAQSTCDRSQARPQALHLIGSYEQCIFAAITRPEENAP